MEILTKAQIVKEVPARWAEQYKNYHDPHKAQIGEELNALKGDALNPDRIYMIIGNDSWTELKCDECDKHKDAVMMMGTDPEWGGHKVGICLECLSAAVSALGEPR